MRKIQIDGSLGEGGGQILRTALSLSCVTGHPLRLFNIRKGRRKPGLMPQHITCVNAAAMICDARVRGNEPHSQELAFVPGKVRGGTYVFDIKTAGSSSLVLQSVLPPLVFSGSDSLITIKGGTHVPYSPSYHYVSEVFIPVLERLGIRVEPQIKKYGFYPKGGGEVGFRILPAGKINGLSLSERKKLKSLRGCSAVSGLPVSIAERQRDSMVEKVPADADIQVMEVPSPGQGTFVFLKAEYANTLAGFSSLGERGKPAENVGREAAEQFEDFNGTPACVDQHLADQIVIYLSLAHENSSFTTSRITRHLMTNLQVIEKFLNIEYQIEGELNKEGRVIINKKTADY
jgi:RNA 3'-terminal phosphate cyclase (ATP)